MDLPATSVLLRLATSMFSIQDSITLSLCICIVAMLVSLVIYLANKKNFPDPAAKLVSGQSVKQQVPDMPMSEVNSVSRLLSQCLLW